MCSKSRLKSAKRPLPVDVRRSKTSLLKLPNDYVSDIIKWGFYKLVEIKLKAKSYEIENEIHVTLNGIYEPTCHSV